jgi:hypothetical protein
LRLPRNESKKPIDFSSDCPDIPVKAVSGESNPEGMRCEKNHQVLRNGGRHRNKLETFLGNLIAERKMRRSLNILNSDREITLIIFLFLEQFTTRHTAGRTSRSAHAP